MSTLPLHVPHLPAIPGLERLLAALAMVMDVWVESQQKARAAHEHCPFVDW